MPSELSVAEKLCLNCGLCCNGVIFADVQLQKGDAAGRLRLLGLPVKKQSAVQKISQPCAAFKDCQCRIYSERPMHCRQFECLLLQNVKGSLIHFDDALSTVRVAQKRVEKVKRLLRALGNADEHIALVKRFQRTKKRMESSEPTMESAEMFGQLSLAVHRLNVLLSKKFYS